MIMEVVFSDEDLLEETPRCDENSLISIFSGRRRSSRCEGFSIGSASTEMNKWIWEWMGCMDALLPHSISLKLKL